MSDPPVGWDFDDDDALDTEPADPEQVARKLHQLRTREGFELAGWDALDAGERAALVIVATALLAWLHRQGSFR